MHWNRETLLEITADRMAGVKLIVASNRAPYTCLNEGNAVSWERPASGMALALDPIMRACGGVWIAQGDEPGGGDFYRLRRIGLPPEKPAYTLRPVVLPPMIRDGFYNGLANGSLWPLCHTAFRRPQFDPCAWVCYQIANEIFADTILEEANGEPAFVFVQDFHFALLPSLLRERNPNLVVGQFWHIPWPAPEVFLACPWHQNLLTGMMGNDLLGFHLRRHCANFLETVDQAVEARVDKVAMEIHRGGHTTLVRPFPISIDFEEHDATAAGETVALESAQWLRRLGNPECAIGIGIDRLDYTKGIPERLLAIDSLFKCYPEYRGRLQFVQIGVPSRQDVAGYRDLAAEVAGLVDHVNALWATSSWRPIEYFQKKFSQIELMGLHKLADFCLVSSLHDGMNLVAKEFVASRADDGGVLLLSQFAGASAELTDALIFNPHDLIQTRETIRAALELEPGERSRRMQRLREVVAANNIYKWAGKILTSLTHFENVKPQEAISCSRTL
jgi:trehalose 6-phosphate synthase